MAHMHRNHDLIGSSEASNLCNVDRATFNRWAANGEIEPVGALPGRTGARLYARTDVLALADRKAVAA